MQEDDDDEIDEIDELAGDEGKSWHPSASPCAHARHAPPSLTVLSYGAWKRWTGPTPKILFPFELDDAHA